MLPQTAPSTTSSRSRLPTRGLGQGLSLALLTAAALVTGCGEGDVTQYETRERPIASDYKNTIDPLLSQMGCGNPGCHSVPLGGLLLTQDPDAVALDDNFKSVKALIDRDRPDDNPLVNATVGENHPIKCAERGDCAALKLEAWISSEALGSELADLCDSSMDGCF